MASNNNNNPNSTTALKEITTNIPAAKSTAWNKRKSTLKISLENVKGIVNEENLTEEVWSAAELDALFVDGMMKQATAK